MGETLGGLTTIRAYGQPLRFAGEFEQKVNQNTRASYANKTAERWLAIRLETIGSTVAGTAALLATYTAMRSEPGNNGSFASFAGLSLNLAIGVTGLLQFGVRTFAQMENSMNSCERIL